MLSDTVEHPPSLAAQTLFFLVRAKNLFLAFIFGSYKEKKGLAARLSIHHNWKLELFFSGQPPLPAHASLKVKTSQTNVCEPKSVSPSDDCYSSSL